MGADYTIHFSDLNVVLPKCMIIMGIHILNILLSEEISSNHLVLKFIFIDENTVNYNNVSKSLEGEYKGLSLFCKRMGLFRHEVKVVHFRSVFPHIYKLFMSFFPKFVERYFAITRI